MARSGTEKQISGPKLNGSSIKQKQAPAGSAVRQWRQAAWGVCSLTGAAARAETGPGRRLTKRRRDGGAGRRLAYVWRWAVNNSDVDLMAREMVSSTFCLSPAGDNCGARGRLGRVKSSQVKRFGRSMCHCVPLDHLNPTQLSSTQFSCCYKASVNSDSVQ